MKLTFVNVNTDPKLQDLRGWWLLVKPGDMETRKALTEHFGFRMYATLQPTETLLINSEGGWCVMIEGMNISEERSTELPLEKVRWPYIAA